MSVKQSYEKWFNVPAGFYCGLYVKEKTAKKLQKLLWKQTQEIKQLLMSNIDDLAISEWTLAYPLPDKKQKTIYYTCKEDEWDNIKNRIELINKADRIKYIDKLFVSDKQGLEARKEVEQFYIDMYSEEGE